MEVCRLIRTKASLRSPWKWVFHCPIAGHSSGAHCFSTLLDVQAILTWSWCWRPALFLLYLPHPVPLLVFSPHRWYPGSTHSVLQEIFYFYVPISEWDWAPHVIQENRSEHLLREKGRVWTFIKRCKCLALVDLVQLVEKVRCFAKDNLLNH